MKDINKVGLIGILIIIISAINFLTIKWSLINSLYFLVTSLGVGYLTSRLQKYIKQESK